MTIRIVANIINETYNIASIRNKTKQYIAHIFNICPHSYQLWKNDLTTYVVLLKRFIL